MRRALPATVAALTLLAGCVVNPVTGEMELSVMSPEREAALGRQAAEQVEQQIGLVPSGPLTRYVEQLGARLAARSPRRDVAYRFHVADMPEANAFALPGGYLYVSRGLLALTNDEDELAGVLGHEIAHVAARHAAQRETRQLGVGLLAVLGTVVGGALGGAEAAQTAAQIGQVAGAGLIASYGRDQERQADDLGQRMAGAAGFDPAGITAFLRTLGRETELRLGEPRLPTFLDSHPATGERVESTAVRARGIPRAGAAPIAGDPGDLFALFRGLMIGPDPKGGVFQEQRFLHPEMGFALEFPRGWKTLNQTAVVAALAPEQSALVRLELQGASGDPGQAARAFAEQNGVALGAAGPLRISGYAAYQARAELRREGQSADLHLTWISHPRATFRLMGVAAPGGLDTYGRSFDATARSFHALSSSERSSIKERRLEVARARSGETLAGLSARSGNVWSVEETAVANGLASGARLARDQPVKIAVERPYRP